jgi:hypothetical protein
MFHQQRLPVLLALVCALLLRVLVPTGWMPAPSGGAFAIEPCPAAEPAPMVMAAGSMAKHDHGAAHKDQHGGDCAFSPFHAGSPPPQELAPLPSPVTVAALLPSFSAASPLKTGPPALPPPSTGPPALA